MFDPDTFFSGFTIFAIGGLLFLSLLYLAIRGTATEGMKGDARWLEPNGRRKPRTPLGRVVRGH